MYVCMYSEHMEEGWMDGWMLASPRRENKKFSASFGCRVYYYMFWILGKRERERERQVYVFMGGWVGEEEATMCI